MPLIILAIALFLVVLVIAMPLSLVQRYRMGKARRLGRGWAATLNLIMIAFSVPVFLWGAAVTSLWMPRAFSYSLVGLAGGAVLGVLGLLVTRWEETPRALHYTPNRWLILGLTLRSADAIALRVLAGLAGVGVSHIVARSHGSSRLSGRGSGGARLLFYLLRRRLLAAGSAPKKVSDKVDG